MLPIRSLVVTFCTENIEHLRNTFFITSHFLATCWLLTSFIVNFPFRSSYFYKMLIHIVCFPLDAVDTSYPWCMLTGIRARTEQCRQFPTSRVKHRPTSCLSWPRPCWPRQEATVLHLYSPSPPPPTTPLMAHTGTYTCVPSRSGCMHLDFITVYLLTGCHVHTLHMSPGSQVGALLFGAVTWWQ